MPRVLRAVSRRAAPPLLTIWAASFVIFAGLSLAPGDPVSLILGDRASAESRAEVRADLGLDDPLLVRYWDWLRDAVRGDFGTSLIDRQDVSDQIADRLATSLTLIAMATVLVVLVGIGLGSLGGAKPRLRSAVRMVTGVGLSIPAYVSSIVLIGVFAVQLGWFPTFGAGTGLTDRVWHLTLPAIALSISWVAYIAQLSTAAIVEEADREHVATAVGRGVPRARIFRRHVFRNAATPIITASGLAVAGLTAGTIVVETAFSLGGLGSLLVTSVASKDYPPAIAVSIIIVVVFVTITTAIDLLQVRLDPRARTNGDAA